MQQAIIEGPAAGKQNVSASKTHSRNGSSARTIMELEIELGIWLAAIESFVGTSAHPFADKMNLRAHDWSGDLNLTISGLLQCSGILSELTSLALTSDASIKLTLEELDSLTDIVTDALTVGDVIAKKKPLTYPEWRAWCRILTAGLHAVQALEKVTRFAVRAGEASVPVPMQKLLDKNPMAFADRFDFAVVVPGFSRIMFWLGIVEKMLLADAPLKSSLLIFARVYEDTLDLVGHINRRLQRFSDEDSELFRALDSASYIASIELRKVFDHELAGLVAVRSAITVYARTETAFASLRDNIQQILAGLAKLVDPNIEPHELFPRISEKLEASLKLREELAVMIKNVRAAETDAASKGIPDKALLAFIEGPVPALFYKDRESVERFVEEIRRTQQRKDLVPILHRFGAYLETLFSHVNNRTVLRPHPFET